MLTWHGIKVIPGPMQIQISKDHMLADKLASPSMRQGADSAAVTPLGVLRTSVDDPNGIREHWCLRKNSSGGYIRCDSAAKTPLPRTASRQRRCSALVYPSISRCENDATCSTRKA